MVLISGHTYYLFIAAFDSDSRATNAGFTFFHAHYFAHNYMLKTAALLYTHSRSIFLFFAVVQSRLTRERSLHLTSATRQVVYTCVIMKIQERAANLLEIH